MFNNKEFEIKGFDAKKILRTLEGRKSLCPSCERTLKLAGALYIYDNITSKRRIYYVICRKCEYKKLKQNEEKQKISKEIIESRLENNMFPYSCEEVEDPNIDKILDKMKSVKQNLTINALEMTTGQWHKDDEDFFEDNPTRRFFCRKIYENELHETNKNNKNLQEDAIKKNISFAIVHKVANKQRVYSYASDLTGHPYEEEEFVAALFMVRINDLLTPDDIYDMYEQIKANNEILKKFNLTEQNKKKL